MNRLELESRLGLAAHFIISAENRHLVTQWAISAGFDPASVHSMTAVALANLYHDHGPGAQVTDRQRIAAEAVAATMAALGSVRPAGGPWSPTPDDEELIRYLARVEAQALIDARPPQRIEVISPRGAIILDGPQHYKTATVLRVAALGHPVMMVGPAGCGKTTIGERAAYALQLPFYITNAISEPHELTGFIDGYGKYHSTAFRRAFENGGLWIADEIDAWDASALLTANSALANGFINFPDCERPVQRHANFRMVATANTFGTGADRVYVGRNELDAASLDRFATIEVDYDINLERMFANGHDDWLERVWNVRKTVQEKRIRHVVSSRAIIMGSQALYAGFSREEIEEMYLFKGMNGKDRSKID